MNEMHKDCRLCPDHVDVKIALEKGSIVMKNTNKILGCVAIMGLAIIGFIINLTVDVGKYKAEAVAIVAVETAKVEAMQQQVDHIAKIQQTVFKFVTNHDLKHAEAVQNKPSINVYPHAPNPKNLQ